MVEKPSLKSDVSKSPFNKGVHPEGIHPEGFILPFGPETSRSKERIYPVGDLGGFLIAARSGAFRAPQTVGQYPPSTPTSKKLRFITTTI